MAKKSESNEPQRAYDNEIHPGVTVTTPQDIAAPPVPKTWEEKRRELIAEREAAGVYDAPDPADECEPEPPQESPPALPELDESEKAYVGKLFADVAAARERVRVAEDRGSAYFSHLLARHGLSPEDFINADGSITRNPKAAMEQ